MSNKSFRITVVVLLSLCLTGITVFGVIGVFRRGPQGHGMDLQEATNLALRSSVRIHAFYQGGGNLFSAGSGVIYQPSWLSSTSGTAFIITNYHVVTTHLYLGSNNWQFTYPTEIRVFAFGTSAHMYATFLGGSVEHDIAILQITNSQLLRNLPVRSVDLPHRRTPRVGQSVIAVGNPMDGGISVTEGIVSVASELVPMARVEDREQERSYRLFRISAAVNSGNSGGGVFDSHGNLLGIVMAKAVTDMDGDSIEGIGWAIPLDIALRIADQMIDRRNERGLDPLTMNRTAMGIVPGVADTRFGLTQEGEPFVYEMVYVSSFLAPNFNVDAMFHVNDVFVSVSYVMRGEYITFDVQRSFQLFDMMLDIYQSTTITFVVMRGNYQQTVVVNIVF